MSSGQAKTTQVGNFKRPDLVTTVQWVKAAWDKIGVPMVQYSFKKTGISNSLNGTEDDLLWQEPSTSTTDDSESDDDNVYTDTLSSEQIHALFDETDDEEFLGFN